MKTIELSEKLKLVPLNLADGKREVTCGYAGDLLSWVMGRAPSNSAWVTIMSNVNIVAVAMLRDISAVIIAEGSDVPEDVINKAREQEINIFSSDKDAFTLCSEISELLR